MTFHSLHVAAHDNRFGANLSRPFLRAAHQCAPDSTSPRIGRNNQPAISTRKPDSSTCDAWALSNR